LPSCTSKTTDACTRSKRSRGLIPWQNAKAGIVIRVEQKGRKKKRENKEKKEK
jgi:hypothetical protein